MELYAHNKDTYEKVIKEFDRSNHVAIIQATGTGKSFITMKLFQDYFKGLHKLYVVPNNAIADSIQLYPDWSNENTVFTTYQMLTTIDEETLLLYTKAFDVFLLDEFHHAGARKWSIPVKVLKKHSHYLIGLSATPTRYLDGQRDMSVELFGDSVIYGPNLEEAIRLNILPMFMYVAILYNISEKIEKAEQSLNDYISKYGESDKTAQIREKIISLQLDDKSSYETGVILQKYITNEHKKWLVFCTDISQLEQIDIDLKDWFNDDEMPILAIHSKMTKKQVQDTLRYFSTYKGKIILKSIDILNEGVHVDGVNGIIMLRKTESRNVFLQEVGRALSAGYEGAIPLILDIVGNYDNMKDMSSVCRDLLPTNKSEIEYQNAPYQTSKNLVIVDEVLLSVEELFNSIYNLPKEKPWEDYENRILDEHYKYLGAKVARLLPERSEKESVKQARLRGLVYRRQWTPEEDNIIKEYYPKEGRKVTARIENRSEEAVTSRASKLHVKYIGDWAADEDIILFRFYPKEGREAFKRLPNKSEEACEERVIKLRLL